MGRSNLALALTVPGVINKKAKTSPIPEGGQGRGVDLLVERRPLKGSVLLQRVESREQGLGAISDLFVPSM